MHRTHTVRRAYSCTYACTHVWHAIAYASRNGTFVVVVILCYMYMHAGCLFEAFMRTGSGLTRARFIIIKLLLLFIFIRTRTATHIFIFIHYIGCFSPAYERIIFCLKIFVIFLFFFSLFFGYSWLLLLFWGLFAEATLIILSLWSGTMAQHKMVIALDRWRRQWRRWLRKRRRWLADGVSTVRPQFIYM